MYFVKDDYLCNMTSKAVLLKIFGVFLIVEAIVSIAYSQDQHKISQAGRISRIGIGIALLFIKVQ